MKHQLRTFIKVAEYASFTMASKELNLSQPAVSKTIAKLEEEYGTTFFVRSRNTIALTNDGKIFLDYAHRILELFDEMEGTFSTRENTLAQEFHLGLSTTIATYIMPKVLAKIQKSSQDIRFHIFSGNTHDVEHKILEKELDFGIVEGKSSHPLLKYTEFLKDEIVLVTSTRNKNAKKAISKQEVGEIPFVSREVGSGTRAIVDGVLKANKVPGLNRIITLNSTEAIEQYLHHSNTYALVSIHAVTENLVQNTLRIVDIKGLGFERDFYFVTRTGFQSKKIDLLMRLIQSNYNF